MRGPSYANNTRVRPGDTITYRLRYYLPTGDVETFSITDYLPLPVFDVSSFSTTLNTTISAAAPAAGTAKYGPDHTFSRIPASAPPTRNPVLSVSPSGNSVTFDFGTFDDPPPEVATVVDLLLSATITNAPMADGLFLTNQVSAIHGTTNAGSVTDDAIVQIVLTQPVLGVRKGIVSTSNASGTFSRYRGADRHYVRISRLGNARQQLRRWHHPLDQSRSDTQRQSQQRRRGGSGQVRDRGGEPRHQQRRRL